MRNHSLSTLCRPLAGLVSTLLIVLAPVGCRKEPGPPSPEYEQARQQFSKLYGQKLDEAFLDPGMEEVEALLQQVPPESMDAQPARELLQRIQQGRARMEAARQETEEAIASARQVDEFPTTPESEQPSAPTAAAGEPEAGTPDAGSDLSGPVAGTPASELSFGYQRCFQRGQPINVDGRGSREAWELVDRLSCRQAFPSFVEQVVLIEEGRVLTVLPKSAVRVTYVGADGGPVPGR